MKTLNPRFFGQKVRCLVYLLLFSGGNLYSMNPDREYTLTPDSLGLNFESVYIKTSDGFDLNTWIYLPESEKENNYVLILAYPDKGNMSYFVYHAATLAAAGFTVVTFDYRGFGKSSDFPINSDFLYHTEFTKDLVAVVNEIDNKFPQKKIGAWAMSMGTIVVTRSMEQLNNKIDFIVSEGFVTNTSMIVERIAEQKNEIVVLPESHKEYKKNLSKLKVPLLILSASNDQLTKAEDAINLKKNNPGDIEVVVYEGTHLTGFQAGEGSFGQFYVEEINEFVDKSF